MTHFDIEDGPLLVGPWPTYEALLEVLEGTLLRAGHRRVARCDFGFTYLARVAEGADGWWFETSLELGPGLPAGLSGFAATPVYPEDDEWGQPESIAVYAVRSEGAGQLTIERTLNAYRADKPTEAVSLLGDALRAASGAVTKPERVVYHEPASAFSCLVVARTFEALRSLAPGSWEVEAREDSVRLRTAFGLLPARRALSRVEWEEIAAALRER